MRKTGTYILGPICALGLLAACSSANDQGNTGAGAGTTTSGSAGGPATGGTGGGKPDGGVPPPEFWDTSNIPPAKNVMTFKFLNRTNGKYKDSEVFWSFKQNGIDEVHSIAEAPTYDMPVSASGRMYFHLGAPDSKYYDFIEHTIGDHQYNGNTTRVDAFGLKIAMRLHCADGYEITVGEDHETFQEDRTVTFQKFIDEVPEEFKHLAQIQAPYRIVEPGAGEFKQGGKYEHYYDASADAIWAANGLSFPKPGPNGSGLGAYPNVSAALMRNVGNVAGSLTPDGQLMNDMLWKDSTTFYTAPPADYYAKFWHTHGIDGKAYGFPYDDVGSYSSYISHKDPEYLVIAIGW
ncbi:MAG: glycoside hydrolase family 64 protein [Minicystis sp.]